eukprot:Skav232145  [mRNA]  locus=scaffold1040:22588:24689:- [translate_table: standard]
MLQVADALAEFMGLRGNSTADGMDNRRDKRVQQNAVKKAGVRSVRSACGTTWSEDGIFGEVGNAPVATSAEENYPLIVKPVESAGSDGVKKCNTKDWTVSVPVVAGVGGAWKSLDDMIKFDQLSVELLWAL